MCVPSSSIQALQEHGSCISLAHRTRRHCGVGCVVHSVCHVSFAYSVLSALINQAAVFWCFVGFHRRKETKHMQMRTQHQLYLPVHPMVHLVAVVRSGRCVFDIFCSACAGVSTARVQKLLSCWHTIHVSPTGMSPAHTCTSQYHMLPYSDP